MKSIIDPKKLPRKIKKNIIKIHGRDTYKQILTGFLSIRPKMIGYYHGQPVEIHWKYKEMCLFGKLTEQVTL